MLGDHFKTEWKAALGCLLRSNQSLAHAVYVCRQHGIADDRHLLANLGGGFLAELNVLLFGEKVEAGLKAMRPLRERRNSETENEYDCACPQNGFFHFITPYESQAGPDPPPTKWTISS